MAKLNSLPILVDGVGQGRFNVPTRRGRQETQRRGLARTGVSCVMVCRPALKLRAILIWSKLYLFRYDPAAAGQNAVAQNKESE